MPTYFFIWDEDRNVPHLAEHDVSPEEAAYVVEHAADEDREVSRTTGVPVVFGETATGRHLMVVYWFVDEMTVWVETAYEVPPRTSRNRTR